MGRWMDGKEQQSGRPGVELWTIRVVDSGMEGPACVLRFERLCYSYNAAGCFKGMVFHRDDVKCFSYQRACGNGQSGSAPYDVRARSIVE